MNKDNLEMPVEELYSSPEAKPLVKAMQYYADKDFGKAATYSKELANIRKNIENDQLYVLAEFFRLHLDAYDVWDGTYDYKKITKLLKESIDFLERNKLLFQENDRNYLTALKKLSELVILGTEYENSMITSDANTMMTVSENMVREAAEGIAAIRKVNSFENENSFAHFIYHQLHIKLKSQEAIGKFAYLMDMKEKNPELFLTEYPDRQKEIKEALDYLVSIKDFELASELRAHYFFLEKSYGMISDCVQNGFIKLRDGEIHYFVGILVDDTCARHIYNRLIEDESGCNITEKFKEYNIELCCKVLEEDPSDLLAESYKFEDSAYMKWLTLRLNDVSIMLHGELYKAEFYLHYYNYGVCNLCLKINLPDKDYSPSKLMLLRSLIGPHMGQTEIEWQGNKYLYIAKEDGDNDKTDSECSVTLFRDVSDSLNGLFKSFAEEIRNKDEDEDFLWEYNPEMNWFSFIYVRSAFLKKADGEEENIMDGRILEKAPEFKALLLDSREARASIDDWIGSKEPDVKNLALIRSHKNDMLTVGENHATVYFPEDPEFIIFQYNESLEMLANLRTITNAYNSVMNQMLRESKEVTNDIYKKLQFGNKTEKRDALERIKKHMLKITKLKIQTEYMCNLTMSSTISQYRDHAKLMDEMIKNTTIPQTLESIRVKVRMIAETEESLDDIVDSIRTIEEARLNSYIEIFGTTIGIVALLGGTMQMLPFIFYSEELFWETHPLTRILLSISIMIVAFLFVKMIVKFLIDYRENEKTDKAYSHKRRN